MNHLAHFALAGDDPLLIVGSFLGDYVKGRLAGQFPDGMERGIRLHRAIDAYTDQHPVVRQSQQRFDPRFRRYAGIMTDIIYDHLLAQAFNEFHDASLDAFSSRVLGIVVEHEDWLPPRAAGTARRMFEINSLAGHGSARYVEGAFSHLATRLRRDNPLPEAAGECQKHLDGLRDDLSRFYPELADFCDHWRKTH